MFTLRILSIVLLCFCCISHASNSLDYKAANQKVVAIDIGHSKHRWGATSSRGVGEYWFNHAVAKVLHEKLNKAMIDVVIINDHGNDISLKQRVSEINRSNASLLVSIHHDSVQPKYLNKWEFQRNVNIYCDIFSGFSIFVSKKNVHYSKSLNLANIIGSNFIHTGLEPSLHHSEPIEGESRELLSSHLGIYNANFAVLSQSNISSVLVECGIILNRYDELKLGNLEYQTKIAEALSASVISYLENY